MAEDRVGNCPFGPIWCCKTLLNEYTVPAIGFVNEMDDQVTKKTSEQTGQNPGQENPVNPERERALNAALAQIERQFGKGSLMRLGDQEQVAIPSISTGSLGLDVALGIGGLPRGRVVEIYGPESSGKTTLTLQVVAEAQKAGGTCAFIDAEHALDPIYAQNLGVNTDDLLVSQPTPGNRRWKSATCWCVPMRWTSSWWTPLRH